VAYRSLRFLIMQRILLIGSVLLVLAGGIVSAHAEPAESPAAQGGVDRLQSLLDRVKASQGPIRRLHADFTESKESSLMLQPLHAAGQFYYQAPDKVRWEYDTPEPMTLLIRNDEMVTWYRDLHEARRTTIGRQSQQILKYLGMGSSVADLLEYFDVGLGLPKQKGDPYRLVLTPRYKRVAKRIQKLSVWIDSQRYLPVRFLYEEPDGDRTEYRFTNLRINQQFDGDPFELHLPDDVKIQQGEDGARLRP